MQEDEYATVSVSYLPGPDGFNETENYEENLEAGIEEAETIHTALADKPVLPPGIKIYQIKKSRKSRNRKPNYLVRIEKSGFSVSFKTIQGEKNAYRYAETLTAKTRLEESALEAEPEIKAFPAPEIQAEVKPEKVLSIRAVADKPLSIPGAARKNRKPWEALNYTLEF
jgi:hypothetical protein